jgi:hypothetical protein
MEMQDCLKSCYVKTPDRAVLRILIMGGSQEEFFVQAACNGAPLNHITSVAPPNFASSWIENGCVKMTLLWTVEYTPDTARYTPLVDRMSNWIYADTKKYWDSLAYWLPVDRDFMNEVHNCSIPVLVEGSWQDKFFNADGVMMLKLWTTRFIIHWSCSATEETIRLLKTHGMNWFIIGSSSGCLMLILQFSQCQSTSTLQQRFLC